MKEIRMYRLFDGGDEVEKSGWHFSRATAEKVKPLYNNKYIVKIREVPATIDTLRNAIFLYQCDYDYISRAELVNRIGEEEVKRLEDLKKFPAHTRDNMAVCADTVWDEVLADNGDVYGVGCLDIPMTGENETKGRMFRVSISFVTYNGKTTRVLYEVPYYADFDREAFRSLNDSINNFCKHIEKECNKFDFWGEIEKSMEDFNNKTYSDAYTGTITKRAGWEIPSL